MMIDEWQQGHNLARPRSSLACLASETFRQQHRLALSGYKLRGKVTVAPRLAIERDERLTSMPIYSNNGPTKENLPARVSWHGGND
jgi:hypothetical protein